MTNDASRRLFLSEQIRAIEQFIFDRLQVAGYTLMSRAGEAVFRVMQEMLEPGAVVLVFCGPGNNAGDGYVVARLLAGAGHRVTLVSLSDAHALHGDAAMARDDWLAAGGKIHAFEGVLPAADVIVDAIFGIGLSRPLEGTYREAIDCINAAGKPVLAIDMPSGLCSETGRVLGVAVRADTTVTFIGLKAGQFLLDGPDHCGELILDDLDTPAAAYDGQMPVATLLDESDLPTLLPPRLRNCHKGNFGHVLVAGGAPGMQGAARMAGEAAARVGAGLVGVATHPAHAPLISATCPVLMAHGVADASRFRALLKKATVLAIGPGLGQGDWGRMLFSCAEGAGLPKVVDADALNLLAANPQQDQRWIITPHPGEAGRLLGMSAAEVQQNRLQAVRALQQQYGGVAVLKGQGTLVAAEDVIWLCPHGNPGMASGGMGDVLTGIIAGLLAQGLPLPDAARAGVLLHALAADHVAGSQPRGLLATDLLPVLREWVNPDVS